MAKAKTEVKDYRQTLLEGQNLSQDTPAASSPAPSPAPAVEPEVEATPEPEESPAPAEPAETSDSPGLVQQLQELGFENIEDDSTAQQRLVEAVTFSSFYIPIVLDI